jgi:hypothetical protein
VVFWYSVSKTVLSCRFPAVTSTPRMKLCFSHAVCTP